MSPCHKERCPNVSIRQHTSYGSYKAYVRHLAIRSAVKPEKRKTERESERESERERARARASERARVSE